MTPEHSILIVGNFLSVTNGSYSVCEDLAGHLLKAGWTVFTTSNKSTRIPRLMDMLCTVWNRRHQFNVATIDTFSGLAFFWAEIVGFALHVLGKPFVLILHGGDLPGFASRFPGRVTRLFKMAAVVTVPSMYLLDQMHPFHSSLLLLPNPIETQKYKFIPRKTPEPVLVWLRAFHAIYNAPMAIQTLRILNKDKTTYRLLMGGGDKADGSLQKVKKLVEEYDLSSEIDIVGPIPKVEIPTWLQNGDIFLNTTNVDNTPISVLEAMACGLCVISTNVGGIPYLLKHESDSLLVAPNDPEAMASAIRRLYLEPNLAAKLTYNARREAEKFDWSVILPRWEALLSDVICSHNGRDSGS